MRAPLILFLSFLCLVYAAGAQELVCPCQDRNPCDVWDSAKLVVKANITDVINDPDNSRVIYSLTIITNYRGDTGSILNATTNRTQTGPSATPGSSIKLFAPPFDHPCAVDLELDHVYLITAAADRNGNLFISQCLTIVMCGHNVCGSDGKSYSSECELREEMCTNPSLNLYKRGDIACLATCDVRQCGPRPLVPEVLCSDGVTLSGVGYCVRQGRGCNWDIVACPCERGNNVVPDGFTSISPTDACTVDVCDNGQLLTTNINCPPVQCDNPLILPRTCCPVCPPRQAGAPGTPRFPGEEEQPGPSGEGSPEQGFPEDQQGEQEGGQEEEQEGVLGSLPRPGGSPFGG